jgi:hypothetical protein
MLALPLSGEQQTICTGMRFQSRNHQRHVQSAMHPEPDSILPRYGAGEGHRRWALNNQLDSPYFVK